MVSKKVEESKKREREDAGPSYEKMSRKDLVELCRTRLLGVSGSKAVLVARLEGRAPPAKGGSKKAKMEGIHLRLAELGVEDPKRVNSCLKAAILNGHYSLNEEAAFEQVVHEGPCIQCSATITVRMRDCLYQPPHGSMLDDHDPKGAISCAKCDSGETGYWCSKQYITGLCTGKP